MRVYDLFEQRLTLPGDNETVRSQKTISTMLMFVGALFTLINLFTFLSLGLTTASMIYAGLILFILCGGLLILAIPRWWLPVGLAVMIGIIGFSLALHVFSGGFQGGMEEAIWMLLSPIAVALFMGRRYVISTLAFFILGVIAAAYLEPFAQAIAPELALGPRMRIAATNLILMGVINMLAIVYLVGRVEYYRRRAEDLLLNMLPRPIAARLKESSETIADSYDEVTVLFADMVGSTPLFADLDPAEAVDWLNEVFSMFDDLVERHGLEKIRTIGDNYMVASGVPEPRADHAQVMAQFALDMLRGVQEIPARQGKRMAFRVGINSGPLVAGVIGRAKYQYDLWGDTVNIASRMESSGEVGKVQISQATYELIKDDFMCVSRGQIPVKGRGEMTTWYVVDEASLENSGS